MTRISRVSKACVRLVAEFEGGMSKDGRFHPYVDPVGVWTIGYGETQGLIRILKGRTPSWSARKARRVLRRRLNRDYAPHVTKLRLPLKQPMFDALVSFIYNVGPGALAPSNGIGRELRAHHWHHAADEFLKWNKGGGHVLPGLVRRRHAERALFRSALPQK